MVVSDAPVYRSASVGDARALLAFWERAAFGRTVSDDESSVAVLLAHPTSRCVVAEVGGSIVGTLVVGWDGWRVSLYRLAVDASWRRQGVGVRLVGEAERLAASWGAVRLDAMVDVDNPSGVAFWSALGFRSNAAMTRFERRVVR